MSMNKSTMYEKFDKLKKNLRDYKHVLVAFSGGVDSSFLLQTAYEELGVNAESVTICTPFMPEHELKDAILLAEENNIQHKIINMPVGEYILNNPENRCYACKKNIFNTIKDYAVQRNNPVILDGSNYDDTKNIRPGMDALKELGIKSPLLESGISWFIPDK